MSTTRQVSPGLVIQGFEPPLRLSDFRLIAFDMDSTLIDIECIDEIADAVGRMEQVSAITEAAMRGEITDFSHSLRERVALLRGVPVSALERVYRHRMHLHPGVLELVAQARWAGLATMVVSGGFTFFTDRLQKRLGLDHALANTLEIVDGELTGRVLGDIVDGATKRRTVEKLCAQLGCPTSQAIVVGDGANDLDMMSVAGLSVAYRAKPRVRKAAKVCIDSGRLDRLFEVLTPSPL